MLEGLAKIKRIIVICCGVFIVILPVNIWWSTQKRIVSTVQASESGVGQVLPNISQRILSEQKTPLRDDIFRWVYATAPTTAAGQEVVAAASLANNFKVVGILRGAKNSVLVEDMANHKTILLTAGQPGDVALEKIDGQQVTLRFQGQLIELQF